MAIALFIVSAAALAAAIYSFYIKKELEEEKNNLSKANDILSKTKAELDNTSKNLSAIKKENEDLANNLNRQEEKGRFIADVINSHSDKNKALEEYNRLLNVEYQAYANKNDSLAEEANAMQQLIDAKEQLELAVGDADIIKKNIIAICGAFSSGKSSFMNSFFDQEDIVLPVGLDQTTAIAAYVMPGNDTDIIGYSFSGGKVKIPSKIFPMFRHGREEEFNFNMKDIIGKIVFKTKFVQDFENICFIDTPGFNAGSNSAADHEIAMTALSGANAMIWCFAIDNGTIKEDEMKILREISGKMPMYIVAARADIKPEDEREEILANVENELELNGIEYDGISLYTTLLGEKVNTQPEEYLSSVRKKTLIQFLEQLNLPNKTKEKYVKGIIKSVFEAYINADNVRIAKLNERIDVLSKIQAIFNQVIDGKDADISRYKGRMDKSFIEDTVEDDMSEDNNQEIIENGIPDIIESLQETVEKDKKDIKSAEKLRDKFLKCVRDIFRQTNAED